MNSTPDEEIGLRLQKVRERQNLNQAQAVRALRSVGLVWSQGTLSKVESGIRPVRLAELPAISRALGVSQSDLLAPEDPITTTLERMRVVESTAREAYSDLRYRYLSAAATRRSIQLLVELSEGRPGPYTVSCSSTRFLQDGLRDEYSETGLAPEDALARLGVNYVASEGVKVESEDDWETLNASLPEDYKLALGWEDVERMREAPVESGYNSIAHIQRTLTEHAMGKALEAKFPQVSFSAANEPRLGYHFKENLVISGIQESDDA